MNKKELLFKLLKIEEKEKKPSFFWIKEYGMLKKLLKQFPNQKFWENEHFNKVLSLKQYDKETLTELKKAYKKYNFEFPIKNQEIKLGKKVGKKYNKPHKIKTIKQFLNKNEEKNE